jgi:hypothetical protein
MLVADPEQVRASMVANRDLWVTAAMFDNAKGRDRERSLSLIMSASDLERANTQAKWRHEIETCYPDRQNPGAEARSARNHRPASAHE